MHVSQQPNSERWVQSNSPFSLVLRDRVDLKLAVAWSKLVVAWSKLLAKADWDREWDWLREQWDGEAGEWEREWLGSVCERVKQLMRAWECASALCEGEGEWECRLICVRWVRSYFWKCLIWNRVSNTRFHFK